jgi:hypothetical protein
MANANPPPSGSYGVNPNSMSVNNSNLPARFLPPLDHGIGLASALSSLKGGIEMDRSVSAPPNLLKPGRVDESQMVDSLFGPSGSTADEVDQSHLFSGFHSLSLYDDDVVGSGADSGNGGAELPGWSSSLPEWGGGMEKTTSPILMTELEGDMHMSASTSLFAGVNDLPAPLHETQQHPPQSRFGWAFPSES